MGISSDSVNGKKNLESLISLFTRSDLRVIIDQVMGKEDESHPARQRLREIQ